VLFTRIEERGILKGWELTERTDRVRHIFGFAQEYEYLNNASQVFGAQIFSAGLISKYDIRPGVLALTDASLMVFPLAGIRTVDFENPDAGRHYDYAPGGGARVAGRVYLKAREVLALGYGVAWAHTVNGLSTEQHSAVLPRRGARPHLRADRRGCRLLVVQPEDDLSRLLRAAQDAGRVADVRQRRGCLPVTPSTA
jgi:hypothetical protein